MKRPWAKFSKPFFWVILIVFLAVVFLQYSQYLPLPVSLEHHIIYRILFLGVIILSGLWFGLTIGLVYLFLSAVAMLPILFLSSSIPANDIFEVILVIVAGVGFNLWFEARRREVVRREQARLKLEAVQREVQEHIKTVRENEKRIAVLHSVTTAINQFSNLESILSTAVDKIMEAVDVDSVLIYLINDTKKEFELKQYRGISDSLSSQFDHLKVEDGFNGIIKPATYSTTIENSSNDPILSAEIMKNNAIMSQFVVPLKAQDKVVGTLCALSHSAKVLPEMRSNSLF